MTKPITKSQFSDMWLQEFVVKDLCGLCGNHGFIDTRGKIYSPAGVECGGRFYCICPNGRAIKQARAKP